VDKRASRLDGVDLADLLARIAWVRERLEDGDVDEAAQALADLEEELAA
jgi:hypothetical protein